MTGYIKLHRAVFNHYLLDGDEFSRREAWIWLISQASWKAKKFRHQRKLVPLERGQLPAGRAKLAQLWGWGEQQVRTFLKELKHEGMITSNTNHGVTVITICNYSDYQDEIAEANQPDNQSDNQEVTSSQPAPNHTKEGKELKERERKERDARAREMKNALNPTLENSDVQTDHNGAVTLQNGFKAHWLTKFDNDPDRLELALSGFTIQKNSRTSPEAQVAKYLGAVAGRRLDNRKNYNNARKPKNSHLPIQQRMGRH